MIILHWDSPCTVSWDPTKVSKKPKSTKTWQNDDKSYLKYSIICSFWSLLCTFSNTCHFWFKYCDKCCIRGIFPKFEQFWRKFWKKSLGSPLVKLVKMATFQNIDHKFDRGYPGVGESYIFAFDTLNIDHQKTCSASAAKLHASTSKLTILVKMCPKWPFLAYFGPFWANLAIFEANLSLKTKNPILENG